MSASQAFSAYGSTVAMNGNSLVESTKFTFTGSKLDTDEVTHMQSPQAYKEFRGMLKDAGEVTIDGNFIPNSAGRARVSDAYESRNLQHFLITLPEGLGTFSFDALITMFRKIDMPVDKHATETFTLKISGPVHEDFGS